MQYRERTENTKVFKITNDFPVYKRIEITKDFCIHKKNNTKEYRKL